MSTSRSHSNTTLTVYNGDRTDDPSANALVSQRNGKRQVGDLAEALGHCDIAMTRQIDAELADIGLTEAQFRVLRALGSKRRTSADLARACNVSPQAMVGLITALERKGFITRTPMTRMGRAIDTTITPTGRSALDTARRRVKATEQRLQLNLTATEHDHLVELLRQVAADLNRMRIAPRRPRRPAQPKRLPESPDGES